MIHPIKEFAEFGWLAYPLAFFTPHHLPVFHVELRFKRVGKPARFREKQSVKEFFHTYRGE